MGAQTSSGDRRSVACVAYATWIADKKPLPDFAKTARRAGKGDAAIAVSTFPLPQLLPRPLPKMLLARACAAAAGKERSVRALTLASLAMVAWMRPPGEGARGHHLRANDTQQAVRCRQARQAQRVCL